MKPTVRTWTQRRFERANVDLAPPPSVGGPNTVHTLSGLAPDSTTRRTCDSASSARTPQATAC